ncbi:hypothetical protein HOLleu_01302 [Holothuria leucospilota]|uniref:Uncharacterized protein n=1 Tax=Holothuria leucospilota TaxID=206669 RepID=A0A9Q1CPS1_HOLLE|nr:hypothetical protein HOLleu_01302 [Holothuria leucospilota]
MLVAALERVERQQRAQRLRQEFLQRRCLSYYLKSVESACYDHTPKALFRKHQSAIGGGVLWIRLQNNFYKTFKTIPRKPPPYIAIFTVLGLWLGGVMALRRMCSG